MTAVHDMRKGKRTRQKKPSQPKTAGDETQQQWSRQQLLSKLSPAARRALQRHEHKTLQRDLSLVTQGVDENFALSQFWYTAETSQHLAQEALSKTQPRTGRVACIACPSIFSALQKLLPPEDLERHVILEIDRRFEIYGKSFVHYDFNKPLAVAQALHHAFDFLIVDPPYLNPDCLGLMAQTLRLLAKSSSTPALFCTGAVLQDTLDPIGFRPLFFRPEHACKLSNEFRVYSNYDARGALGGWETEGKEELDASRGLEQGSKASTGGHLASPHAISRRIYYRYYCRHTDG